MKKLILKWFTHNRGEIFTLIFTEQEQTAILNALWRRSQDDKDNGMPQNETIKLTCKKLAMELH